jgi:anti-sigma B factor antagonist
VRSAHRGGERDLTSEVNTTPEIDMPHTEEILARARVLPQAFTCTATHGGLDAAWVHVTGELDMATAPELERTLLESQRHAGLIVLDLRELAFIDCAGVHTIVEASVRARRAGRRLILVRGRPDIYRVFRLTGSFADIDIGDPDRELRPISALQRSLVARSLLKSG